jgi:hypothetical protein
MSIGYRPALFDAQRFESLSNGDIQRRIRCAILPGRHFSSEIDGFDIRSFRMQAEPRTPIGSIVDYLYDRLPGENPDNPDLAEALGLLGKLTERHGALAAETDYIYLGYLNAGEVATLRRRLEGCSFSTDRTLVELAAMVKILAVAEEHGTGLIFSQQ